MPKHPMIKKLTVTALCAASAWAQAAPDHFDIVGLRLGMTEQQARAALQAHDATLQLSTKNLHYTYSDGVKQFRTEPALAEMQAARVGQPGQVRVETITLHFSQPPKPARLVGVRRIASLDNPPTHEQMLQATIQKYGQPAMSSLRDRLNPVTRLTWAEPGRPQCWRTSTKQAAAFMSATPEFGVFKGLADRQKKGLAPADLSQCGASAVFSAMGDPVSNFTVEMTDMGPMFDALLATQAWISGLEAEARKARIGAGAAPKL